MLGLLNRMAQRGAYVARQAEPGAGPGLAVFSARNSFASPVAVASESQLSTALEQGWLEADPCGTRWRLTRAGAGALKAGKSRAASAAPAKQPAVRPSAPAAPIVNDSESPLAWLRRRRDKNGTPLISAAQFDAGERLRADLWHAQMTPRVTANWSGDVPSRRGRRAAPGAGIEFADSVIAARQRVHRALRAVGAEFAGPLIDVCGHLKGLEQLERGEGWPQRSAKFFLRYALTRLARHYGLIRDEDEDAAIGRRLRHWGASDYRPTLDAWKLEKSGGA